MGVWTAGTCARYAIVPQQGTPILFEFPGIVEASRRIHPEVRPALVWALGGFGSSETARWWAKSVRATLRELRIEREPLGVDRLDATGWLALQREGLLTADANDVAHEARRIKTPEEIEIFRTNGRVGDAIMAEFERAIRPGVQESELAGVMSRGLLAHGGEALFTRLVASGPRTNPWFQEASQRTVLAGDLVAVDTDMIGPEGYVIDFSRTFLCGDRATTAQKEAYRVARMNVMAMVEIVKPGVSYHEFATRVPGLPDAYLARRYPCMLHHVGLEDEGPIVPYPDTGGLGEREIPEGGFEEGMVVGLECFAGRVDAPQGVKLEEQVLVTPHGVEPLFRHPCGEELPTQ
jgi:Xaa-Pro aminopeptidase